MATLTPEKLRDLYLKGTLGLTDILMFIDSTNVATIHAALHRRDREKLSEMATSAPHGDDWDSFRIFSMGGYCNYTPEAHEAEMKRDALRYRTGIEAVRDFLSRPESGT